jgi:phosphatidylserine/phosphatidylglycerophosphate/cardiolipin synthase-like enzyme
VLDVHTLEEGGQTAESIGEALVAWLEPAGASLDLALYDVRLPGPVGDAVAGALRAALRRGVRVRMIYNDDTPGPEPRPFAPAPPRTEPQHLEALGAALKAIPGWRDLMHHKYVVRDGDAVWTGSTNWTLDSWTRQENVIATLESAALAAAFTRNFEQLWETGTVGVSGDFDAPRTNGVQAWFCPGRGRELSHRVGQRIGAARRRVRIATPLITAGPILGALGEVVAEGAVDVAAVCDATQVHEVFHQWDANPRSRWKAPLLESVLPAFTGKRSTPWSRGTVHDFMHAKVTVADDVVLLGSFNLSRSGELNAENVLEIVDAALADRLAAWIDGLRARYPDPVARPR